MTERLRQMCLHPNNASKLNHETSVFPCTRFLIWCCHRPDNTMYLCLLKQSENTLNILNNVFQSKNLPLFTRKPHSCSILSKYYEPLQVRKLCVNRTDCNGLWTTLKLKKNRAVFLISNAMYTYIHQQYATVLQAPVQLLKLKNFCSSPADCLIFMSGKMFAAESHESTLAQWSI